MTYKKEKPPRKPSPIASASVSLSQKNFDRLKDISARKRIPVAILMGRAVDKELESGGLFERDLTLPDVGEGRNSPRAHKLLAFIKINPGFSLEHFIILRADIGIDDIDEMKEAYTSLVVNDLIEEYRPVNPKFPHPKEYRAVRSTKDKGVL